MIDKNGEPMRYMRGYRKVLLQFKRDHPELWKRGISYEPYGYMSIKISIPGKGRLIYDPVGTTKGKITWLEHWVDENESKCLEDEKRSDMYQTFLNKIRFYQREFGATQEDIAKLSGVSSRSIRKYLNGYAVPKVSTMRKICESLGLSI